VNPVKCQECQQNPATVHLTQVINGTKTEIHVCPQCAKEKGYVSQEDEAYSLHQLLSGLFHNSSNGMHNTSQQSEKEKQLQCEKCGMTYQQFARIGKFGCSSCYQAFADRLNPLLRKVHSGNTTHEGKIPKRVESDIHQRMKVRDLKLKLQQAIMDEAFEKAAQYRDQIKELEHDLSQSQDGDE